MATATLTADDFLGESPSADDFLGAEEKPAPTAADMTKLAQSVGTPPTTPGEDFASLTPARDKALATVPFRPETITYQDSNGNPVTIPDFTAKSDNRTLANEALKQAGLPAPPTPEDFFNKNPLAASVANLGQSGQYARAALADIGNTGPSNIKAVATGQPLPIDEQIRQLGSPAWAVPYKIAGSAIEMAPKLGAVALSGPAAPATAAVVFGFDDQGNFHPDQAAINAVLPEVGELGGGLVAKLAAKLKLTNPQALNLVKAGGNYASANAVLAAQALPGWSQMTREQKQDAVAGIMANGLIGLTQFHGIEGADNDTKVATFAESAAKAASGEQPFDIPTGRNLRMPTGGEPVTAEAEPAEPGPPPLKREKVQVPETPPEPGRNLTAADEIRNAKATTKKQVQRFFPERKLSNEEAASLLDDAYPERVEQRRAALEEQQRKDEYARSQQETAEIHGNVQPQPVEGEGQVPAQEGGAGIQPDAEGSEGDVSLKQPEGWQGTKKFAGGLMSESDYVAQVSKPFPEGVPSDVTKLTGSQFTAALRKATGLNPTTAAEWLALHEGRTSKDPVATMKAWGEASRDAAAENQRDEILREMAPPEKKEALLFEQFNKGNVMKPQLFNEGLNAVGSHGLKFGIAPEVVNEAREQWARQKREQNLREAERAKKELAEQATKPAEQPSESPGPELPSVEPSGAAAPQGIKPAGEPEPSAPADTGAAQPERVEPERGQPGRGGVSPTPQRPETGVSGEDVAAGSASEGGGSAAGTAPGVAAAVEPYLKVTPVEPGAARESARVAERQITELQRQRDEITKKQKELEPKVLVQRGPKWQRGRIKASAKKADIKAWQDLDREAGALHVQAEAIRRASRKDMETVEMSKTIDRINDTSRPLVQRMVNRKDLYRQQQQDPPPQFAQALTKALDADTLKHFPDATPGELMEMRNAVERNAASNDPASGWRLDPLLNLDTARRDRLDAMVRDAIRFTVSFDKLSPELQKRINRYSKSNRIAGSTEPVEPVSPTEMVSIERAVKKEVVAEQEAQKKAAAEAEEKRIADEGKYREMLVEAEGQAASLGTNKPSPREVKDKLVARIKGAIDDLIKDNEVTIEQVSQEGNLTEYMALTNGEGVAFGWMEPMPNGKIRVTAKRVNNDQMTMLAANQEEAEWFIKASAATQPGKVAIGVPGDGVFGLNRDGLGLLTVLERAKRMSVAAQTSRPTSGGALKPPGEIKTASQWQESKQYFEMKDDDKVAEYSNALLAFAKRINPEHPENVTTARADEWVKERTNKQVAGKATTEPETPAPTSGEAQAFGGKRGNKTGGAQTGTPPAPAVATTPSQLSNLVTAHTPGLGSAAQGIQSLMLPSSKSAAHLREAERLGAKLGTMHRAQESTATQLRAASRMFDRQGVHNENLAPDQNPGIKFMSAMSTGKALPPREQAIADKITALFEDRLNKLEAAGAPLQTVRDNYFPGMWTRESRVAFNQAMDEAVRAGNIPRNFDPNTATPALRAAIKTRVDELMKEGKGSDADMLSYLTRKPLKGKESFRKEKVFDDIMDAAQFGLRPISANPIDLVKGKLAEMDKSIMANQYFQDLRANGKLKVINPYEETPEGWVRVNDKYGTIYGPPTVKLPEHVDKAVYQGLVKFAKSLGIRHERSVQFPPGEHQSALGLSYTGQSFIRSKFASELSVIAHEIGHQLDERYDLWKTIVQDAVGFGKRGKPTAEASQKQRVIVNNELRAIADRTKRGPYTRTQVEKIAQMVEAYVHAPEMMKQIAPNVFRAFSDLVTSRKELQGLADIKPGLELTKLTGEKYVGLPIVGYRVVPKEAADILNNYLSSSLYNNQYFGGIYKAWMRSANVLNQAQLGMGSAFHAGFTTLDAQISAGADLLKDAYGLVKGNRTPTDLAKTAARWTVASVRTAVTGDQVLNAWRNPDGVMEPRIRDVVKAAELAGGGFKMEHGMTTEQAAKVFRDWFSGHRVRAALRSPVALSELMAKPIMDYLVPRQKAGVFAELAGRIIEQNPGKELETLTPQFRQAWNRVDARLGQVRYDRLFANNTAKAVVQGLVRAPGWSGGTIAEIGGAFPDAVQWAKELATTGKPPADIPDRVAYTISLLTTVAVLNGVLTYALSGKKPSGMDYVAFTDGTTDDRGNVKRWLLPSYMKDLLAYAMHPIATVGNKAHPALSVINDVLNNKDYYGYEIRDPNANVGTQALQTGKYVLKAFEPFWIRGAAQNKQQGSGPAASAAAYLGVMPAPASVTMTPMQRDISDLYHKRTGEGVKPYAKQFQPEKPRDKATADIFMFKRLPVSDKQALWERMTPQERQRYGG